MDNQITRDLGAWLSEKISTAFKRAFQLCDEADAAFQIATMGLITAMGATSGALDAMVGKGPSSDPLSVAKAIIERMEEARGDKATELPDDRIADLERQNSDLQACNNRLLERARKAEAELAHEGFEDALLVAERERDDWRQTAQDCIAFVTISAAQFADARKMDGLHPGHYDLLKRLGARMDDFKRADLKAPPHE